MLLLKLIKLLLIETKKTKMGIREKLYFKIVWDGNTYVLFGIANDATGLRHKWYFTKGFLPKFSY